MPDEEAAVPPTGDDRPSDSPQKPEKVGYQNPPKKHQFKKGQKPPPRKPARAAPSQSPRKLLRRLLAELRRAQLGGKIVWLSTGELVVKKAFELSVQSPTLDRLLIDLQFQNETASEPENILILDREEGAPPVIIGGDDYPGIARAYAAIAKELSDGWAAGTIQLRICSNG